MSDSSTGAGDRSPAAHRPVLLRETLDVLALEPGLTVLDGTVGAGGHSRRIMEQIGPGGTLIGLDRDPEMLRHAELALSESAQSESGQTNFHLRQSSYADMDEVLRELNIDQVDRVLLDLGLSSDQLADDDRGFSIAAEGTLDLRFDVSQGRPAWKWIEKHDQADLADILHRYGEERYSHRIAAEMTRRKLQAEMKSPADVVAAVNAALPKSVRESDRKKSAIRVFQALRIVANDELEQLERALDTTIHRALAVRGRAAVISFHSLEDRLVKTAFRDKDRWHILTPKPITATTAETRMNPRSRTAKLRAATRR